MSSIKQREQIEPTIADGATTGETSGDKPAGTSRLGRRWSALRAIKPSTWFTMLGVCLIMTALAVNVWPRFRGDSNNEAKQADDAMPIASLGSADLGEADADVQLVEFVDQPSDTPDSALLPFDFSEPTAEAETVPDGAAEPAGDHDAPVWFVGTIEDETLQIADTPQR